MRDRLRTAVAVRRRPARRSLAFAALTAGLMALTLGAANVVAMAALEATRWPSAVYVSVATWGGIVGWVAAPESALAPPQAEIDRAGGGRGGD